MKQRGDVVKRMIGWAMLLLGAITLTGAVADSSIGARLRSSGTAAELSADMTGVDRVSVRSDTALIRIAAADRSDLGVNLSGGDPATVRVELVREGSELQIRLTKPWWHSPRYGEPTAVEIWLPTSAHLANLSIDVRTAKVELRDVRLDRLIYNGQTGAFLANGVRVQEADLRLVTGQIQLFQLEGALRAHLTTGKLEAQLDVLTGPITVEQITGTMDLDLPDDGKFTLEAAVRRGKVENLLPRAGEAGSGAVPIVLRGGTGIITIR